MHRSLISLHRKEPSVKSLVFSQWSELLEVVVHALEQNHIAFESLHKCSGTKKFQQLLTRFKVRTIPLATIQQESQID